jgi:hypothetical protein
MIKKRIELNLFINGNFCRRRARSKAQASFIKELEAIAGEHKAISETVYKYACVVQKQHLFLLQRVTEPFAVRLVCLVLPWLRSKECRALKIPAWKNMV